MKWAERFKQFFLKNEQEYLMILDMVKKDGMTSDPTRGATGLPLAAGQLETPVAKPALVE